MITALNVANNILRRAFDEDIDVTPMKLQKLIFFTYCEYLKKTKKPLFAERFGVWRYGPVLESVYSEFKQYRANHIDKFAKDCDGKVFVANESNDRQLKSALDAVWDKYKDYDGIALSKITHQRDSAWYKALEDGREYIDDSDILGGIVDE